MTWSEHRDRDKIVRDEDRVLRALVLPDHERLYHVSVTFRHSVDSLARALPVMVQIMADQSIAEQHRIAQAIHDAQTMPPAPLIFPNDAGLGPRTRDDDATQDH